VKLRDDPPLHLTYCLNVHPGETWEENLAAIRRHALGVRARVAPGGPFGLGLRLKRFHVDYGYASGLAPDARDLGSPQQISGGIEF